jgi:hypothetical protein
MRAFVALSRRLLADTLARRCASPASSPPWLVGLEPGTPRFSVVTQNLSNSDEVPANTTFSAGRRQRWIAANCGLFSPIRALRRPSVPNQIARPQCMPWRVSRVTTREARRRAARYGRAAFAPPPSVSETGTTSRPTGCGPGGRGFESRRSPLERLEIAQPIPERSLFGRGRVPTESKVSSEVGPDGPLTSLLAPSRSR